MERKGHGKRLRSMILVSAPSGADLTAAKVQVSLEGGLEHVVSAPGGRPHFRWQAPRKQGPSLLSPTALAQDSDEQP